MVCSSEIARIADQAIRPRPDCPFSSMSAICPERRGPAIETKGRLILVEPNVRIRPARNGLDVRVAKRPGQGGVKMPVGEFARSVSG